MIRCHHFFVVIFFLMSCSYSLCNNVVLAIFGIFLCFYYEKIIFYVKLICKTDKESSTIVIGILSARENFQQRNAIRNTWLKHYNMSGDFKIKPLFIVGDSYCEIPPEQRISLYGCDKIHIDISNLKEHFFALHELRENQCTENTSKIFHQGFTFRVNHPVVINKLGVLARLLVKENYVKVALKDVQTQEVIIESVLPSNDSHLVDGFLYSTVEPILLPKNYEGLILLEGYLKQSDFSSVGFNNNSGVISFIRVYRTSLHSESMVYHSNLYSSVSASFHVIDLEDLKLKLKNESTLKENWSVRQKNISLTLNKEVSHHNDILLIDVIDIYRNLPKKLLIFFKWLISKQIFSYLLKADDDSIVDIQNVIRILQSDAKFDSTKYWLWSRTRRNWPVNLVGKWADNEYKSVHYPPFPCGAVYVLSYASVDWLSLNAGFLFPYQGEDVSIGIWLSAINADFIEGENFECDQKCNSKSLNRAQTTIDDMHKVWNNFQDCNNLCSCDENRLNG